MVWVQIRPRSIANIIGSIQVHDLVTVFGELVICTSSGGDIDDNDVDRNNNDDDDCHTNHTATTVTDGCSTNGVAMDGIDAGHCENNDHNTTTLNSNHEPSICSTGSHVLPLQHSNDGDNDVNSSASTGTTDATGSATGSDSDYYIQARIIRNINGTNMKYYNDAILTRRRWINHSTTSLWSR
jgi:hypothetical protein